MFDKKLFSLAIKNSKFTSESLASNLKKQGLKISKNTIDAYRKGTISNPPIDKLSAISEILGIKTSFFLDESDKIKVSYIPLIGVASCGVPNISYNDDFEMIPVSADIARVGVYALKADGESMLQKISHGDIVVCDKEMECNNGNIVHYTTIDGDSGIKKYLIDSKNIVTLMPLNSDFPPIMCDVDDVKTARCFKIIADL